ALRLDHRDFVVTIGAGLPPEVQRVDAPPPEYVGEPLRFAEGGGVVLDAEVEVPARVLLDHPHARLEEVADRAEPPVRGLRSAGEQALPEASEAGHLASLIAELGSAEADVNPEGRGREPGDGLLDTRVEAQRALVVGCRHER